MNLQDLTTRQLDKTKHREIFVHELGIFDLRAIARELGIASPTTKKRDELIDLIIDKIYNNTPSGVTSKRGRPFKKLSNLDNIMAQITGADEMDGTPVYRKPLKYEEIVCFAQDAPVFTDVAEEYGEFKGVLRMAPNIAYFVNYETGNKVYIYDKEMKQFDLKAGDYIEVRAKKINLSGDFAATEIYRINLAAAKKCVRVSEEGKPIISSEKLPYGQHNLHCGRRNLIEYKGNLFEDDRFANFANFCKQNGFKLITLGTDTSFEDQIMFKEIPNILNFTTVYGSGYDEGYVRIIDAIALTQRLVEAGEKCVLFVSDIVGIFNTLDMCFLNREEEKFGHKEVGVVIAQKMIALGKALSNGASITLVMTYREGENDALLSEAKKICTLFQN